MQVYSVHLVMSKSLKTTAKFSQEEQK